MLDPLAFDYFSQPRSVADILLEVELFGTGPEAVRLLESLQGRDLTAAERLQVAGLWERQSRWLSVRTAAANLAFVGVDVASGGDEQRAQSSRVLELGLVLDCSEVLLRQAKLPQARLLAGTLSATRGLVESGALSDCRARMICNKLAHLAAGHIAKTHNDWTVHGDANGVMTWQSPTAASTTPPRTTTATPNPSHHPNRNPTQDHRRSEESARPRR